MKSSSNERMLFEVINKFIVGHIYKETLDNYYFIYKIMWANEDDAELKIKMLETNNPNYKIRENDLWHSETHIGIVEDITYKYKFDKDVEDLLENG